MDVSDTQNAQQRPQSGQQITLREFFLVIFLHKWTIIGSFIVLLLAIMWGLSLRQRVFVASVKLFVNRALPQQATIRYVGRLQWEEEINSLAEMGRSQGVLVDTARRYDQYRGWADPPESRTLEIASGLATMVEVVPVQETDIINILVRDTDADTALALAEMYSQGFLNEFRRVSLESHGRSYLEGALRDVEDRIRIAKESKADLQEDTQLFNWNHQEIALTESLQQLELDLARRQRERELYALQVEQERRYVSAPESTALTKALREDNLVNKNLFVVNDLRMNLAELRSRYTDDHRLVRAKRDELREAEVNLDGTIRAVLDEHELQLGQMKAHERLLTTAITELKGQLENVPVTAGRLEYYDAYIEQQWRLYGELITKFSDTQASEAQSMLENQIVQLGPPNIGGVEGETPKIVTVVVAPLFALLLAVAIAFMKEATSHTFQRRAELEDFTGVPVLASFRKI
ncbi:MAG: hypothetical protein R3C71_01020 [Candidatus Krumholzibacteriia bacterium]|nr:hypothetical protein [bacterium]MCB9515078.1 hypothetical protein [Candidatus Latescibacterota bacterium]